jgi:hypothetical protein
LPPIHLEFGSERSGELQSGCKELSGEHIMEIKDIRVAKKGLRITPSGCGQTVMDAPEKPPC